MELKIEKSKGFFTDAQKGIIHRNVAMTPMLSEDYWLYRVKVSKRQAIIAFPKFFTLGIGFWREKDWNCNLPFTEPAEEIYEHIKHNKHPSCDDKVCIEAIRMIQERIKEDGWYEI